MPYNRITAPRFYISYGDWWKNLGYYTSGSNLNWSMIEDVNILQPETIKEFPFLTGSTPGTHLSKNYTPIVCPDFYGACGINFIAVLNHNLDSNFKFFFESHYYDNSSNLVTEKLFFAC